MQYEVKITYLDQRSPTGLSVGGHVISADSNDGAIDIAFRDFMPIYRRTGDVVNMLAEEVN